MADKKTELVVRVDVNRGGSAITATSVDVVGIIVKESPVSGEKENAGKYYTSAAEVARIFGEDSEAAKCAARFFAQATHPDSLYIACVAAKSVSEIRKAVESGAFVSVYHWYVVLDAPTDSNKKEVLALLKELDAVASSENKVFHVGMNVDSDDAAARVKELFDGFMDGETKVSGLTASGVSRDAIYGHDTTLYKDDHVGLSVTSQRCGTASGSVRGTFAHKELVGDSPDELSLTRFKAAMDCGLNVYTTLAGAPDFVFGTTGGPSSYIDTVIKADWLKFRIQEAVLQLLKNANQGYGLDMGDEGIADIGAAVTLVFARAEKLHVIMKDYTITLPLYADLPAKDKKDRRLSGIKGRVVLMDSVHTVVPIEINADLA